MMYELVVILFVVLAAHVGGKPIVTQHTIIWPRLFSGEACDKHLDAVLAAKTRHVIHIKGTCRVREWRVT